LPASNDEFGPKTLRLKLANHPNLPQLEVTQTVRVFFNKWGFNHAFADATPNWFYYWKEGGVVAELKGPYHEFEYNASLQDWAGWYDASGDRLYVCPLAADYQPQEYRGTWTWFNHRYRVTIHSGDDGISNTWADSEDSQVIPVGYGQPYAIAIVGGITINDPVETTAFGDDTVEFIPGVGHVLTTGPDGILDHRTQISSSDVWKEYTFFDRLQQVVRVKHIEPGEGRPWSTVVSYKPDDWLDSWPWGDDEIDLCDACSVTVVFNETGIDRCAAVCTHELKHQELFRAVRLPGSNSPPYQYDPTADSDFVDDMMESCSEYHLCPKPFIGYDTYELRSFWYRLIGDANYGNDNELLAYVASQNPGPLSPYRDWSDTDGKQWKR